MTELIKTVYEYPWTSCLIAIVGYEFFELICVTIQIIYINRKK